MEVADKVRLALAGVGLATSGALLAAGCTSLVDGKPVAETSRAAGTTSSSTRTTTTTRSSSATTGAPAGTIPLEPNDRGYVFIATKSGQTRCQISSTDVGCEAPFTNSPMQDGGRANGVNISADGSVQWVLGNLGVMSGIVTIDYENYYAEGWTIAATVDGTRFTNTGTGHGMFVSIDNVETF